MTNQSPGRYRDDVSGVGPVHPVTVRHGRQMLERNEEGERGGQVSRGHQEVQAECGVPVQAGVNNQAQYFVIKGFSGIRGYCDMLRLCRYPWLSLNLKHSLVLRRILPINNTNFGHRSSTDTTTEAEKTQGKKPPPKKR